MTEPISYENILGANGPFAKAITGYAPRTAQQKLAEAITQTIKESGVLVAEAGTGTGKTFAYLVPALLSRQTTLISTGTKNLQDQLFHRDLPMVIRALGIPVKVALLKGRANYLCRYRLENSTQGNGYLSTRLLADLEEIRAMAPRTRYGEISEITSIAEDSAIWPHVTSTADNCLGTECPLYNDCYLVKARRKAMGADLIVVNHHLFFADLALQEDKLGELLPPVSVVILDEAHQLADIASQFLGQKWGSRQLIDLADDCEQEYLANATDMESIHAAAERVKNGVARLRQAFGEAGKKGAWQQISQGKNIRAAIEALGEEFTFLTETLELASPRSKGLENCWERSRQLKQQFELLTGLTPENQIHWYETFSQTFSLHFTPINVAKEFQALMEQKACAFVMTSATLSAGGSFEHFTRQLGLSEANCLQFDSPFDYRHQALLYVPRYLPDPSTEDYIKALIDAAIPLVELVEGRTFFLFTSHHALQRAAELLATRIAYPILIQGSMAKDQLLKEYRQLGNAVLLGTASFWEGVDVRGDALSCVIIDKLPFASPADPVLQARAAALKKQGKSAFFEDQLPAAVIALKQGAGRLIRDVTDTGILMIADPRLFARDYGKIFLASLPPMARTRDLSQVKAFFISEECTLETSDA